MTEVQGILYHSPGLEEAIGGSAEARMTLEQAIKSGAYSNDSRDDCESTRRVSCAFPAGGCRLNGRSIGTERYD